MRKRTIYIATAIIVVFTAIFGTLIVIAVASQSATKLTLSTERNGDSELAQVLAAHAPTPAHHLTAMCVSQEHTRVAGLGMTPSTAIDIGSITKTFTAELLRKSQRLREDTTIQTALAPHLQHLADKAQIPQEVLEEKLNQSPLAQRTLGDLARHTSGLPRLGATSTYKVVSSAPFNTNPYAGISDTDVIVAALDSQLDNPGTEQYSNFGVALLGQLLALDQHTTYEKLLNTEILEPLRMENTTLVAPGGSYQHSHGFEVFGREAVAWEMDGYQPAGALQSTTEDMELWATYLLDHGTPNFTWVRETPDVVWHNGATAGTYTMLIIDAANRQGVFVASDTTGAVEDLGFTVLDHCRKDRNN